MPVRHVRVRDSKHMMLRSHLTRYGQITSLDQVCSVFMFYVCVMSVFYVCFDFLNSYLIPYLYKYIMSISSLQGIDIIVLIGRSPDSHCNKEHVK